jgi:N-acylneuraminate cytidylyltransferase
MQGMSNRAIAIITARGGSKRILRKNIKDFCGKPMIAWPIEAVKVSGLFDHIIVSTDDTEIAEVAKEWGAEVPFMRPPELSDDHASTDSVVLHAVQESQRIYGSLRYGCCVYPTSPFLTTGDLNRGLDMLLAHKATSAFPVVRYDFPIEHAFLLDGARPCARWPDKVNERSQDLPDHYHDAGMFYWFDVEKFLAGSRLFCDDSVAFVIPSVRCQDINTPEDWEHAEIKFRAIAEQRKN